MILISQVPSKFHCPNCHSAKVTVYGKTIECMNCGYEFSKDSLNSEIDEENILSDQEVGGFLDSFSELKDEKARERFFKSIEKDLKDLEDLEE